MPAFEEFDVPLRIGLVADTHLHDPRRHRLPEQMLDGLDGCDLILHAGDVTETWVLELLAAVAPVRVVAGNGDVRIPGLPRTLYFRFGEHTVGLLHGHLGGGTARRSAFNTMHGRVHCAVYGHSHRPEIVTREGLLMVNPGSPSRRRWAPRHSYGILRVTDAELDPELYYLNE